MRSSRLFAWNSTAAMLRIMTLSAKARSDKYATYIATKKMRTAPWAAKASVLLICVSVAVSLVMAPTISSAGGDWPRRNRWRHHQRDRDAHANEQHARFCGPRRGSHLL